MFAGRLAALSSSNATTMSLLSSGPVPDVIGSHFSESPLHVMNNTSGRAANRHDSTGFMKGMFDLMLETNLGWANKEHNPSTMTHESLQSNNCVKLSATSRFAITYHKKTSSPPEKSKSRSIATR